MTGTVMHHRCVGWTRGRRLRPLRHHRYPSRWRRLTPPAAWQSEAECEVPWDFPVGINKQHQEPQTGKFRVALVTNKNAKQVSIAKEEELGNLVGDDDCFACCSLKDAEDAMEEVYDRGYYSTVVCAGGDGTSASVLNIMDMKLRSSGKTPAARPALGILRLGTGNALAYVVNAKEASKDLDLLVKRVAVLRKKSRLPVLVTNTIAFTTDSSAKPKGVPASRFVQRERPRTLCFFAGLGYDALMLRDYEWLIDKTKQYRWMRPFTRSVFGYLLALTVKTIPATLRSQHVFRVRMTNLATEAFYVDPNEGDALSPRPKGVILFEGEVGIACMGTIPYYGGGVQLFPFAGWQLDMAHVRFSDHHPVAATLHLRSLWNGRYRNRRHVFDFLVREAVLETDRPVPFQHSGEAAGKIQKLHVQVRKDGRVDLVDFSKL